MKSLFLFSVITVLLLGVSGSNAFAGPNDARPRRTNKGFILTGAPGSGKTSIVLSMQALHEAIVMPETAEELIRLARANGNNTPWLADDWQYRVASYQKAREQTVRLLANAASNRRFYLDRSAFDCLAYCFQSKQLPSAELLGVLKTLNFDDYHRIVFFIMPSSKTETNDIRRENHQQALELDANLRIVYSALGFNIVNIPFMPLEDRVMEIKRAIFCHGSLLKRKDAKWSCYNIDEAVSLMYKAISSPPGVLPVLAADDELAIDSGDDSDCYVSDDDNGSLSGQSTSASVRSIEMHKLKGQKKSSLFGLRPLLLDAPTDMAYSPPINGEEMKNLAQRLSQKSTTGQ